MMQVVAAAVAVNARIAGIERDDTLIKPQIPCPLVQPEPKVVLILGSMPMILVAGMKAGILREFRFLSPSALAANGSQRQASDGGEAYGQTGKIESRQKVDRDAADDGNAADPQHQRCGRTTNLDTAEKGFKRVKDIPDRFCER